MFWLFIAIAVIDLINLQLWKEFDDIRVQGMVYDIGVSFLFLLFYTFAWLAFRHLNSLNSIKITRIADCLSAGWVILALNDLYEECTGQNQSDTPWEWIGFGLIVVIRGFYIYRIIKWSKL